MLPGVQEIVAWLAPAVAATLVTADGGEVHAFLIARVPTDSRSRATALGSFPEEDFKRPASPRERADLIPADAGPAAAIVAPITAIVMKPAANCRYKVPTAPLGPARTKRRAAPASGTLANLGGRGQEQPRFCHVSDRTELTGALAATGARRAYLVVLYCLAQRYRDHPQHRPWHPTWHMVAVAFGMRVRRPARAPAPPLAWP